MREMLDHSATYEIVPAAIDIPTVPILAPDSLSAGSRGKGRSVQIRGVRTLPVRIDNLVREASEAKTRWQRLNDRGDIRGMQKLLRDRTELNADADVIGRVAVLCKAGRWRGLRGRPLGAYRWHPLLVRGLIDLLVKDERCKSRHAACAKLEDLGSISYDEAKRLDFQARRESRFRAHISLFEEAAQSVSIQELPTAVESLQSSGVIHRSVFNSALGPVDIALSALK